MLKSALLPACLFLSSMVVAQVSAIRISNDKTGATIPATLHGIFFEEISHAGEGGLYGELIQNRSFEEYQLPAGTEEDNGYLRASGNKPHFMLEPKKADWRLEWKPESRWPGWSASNTSSALKLSLSTELPLNEQNPTALRIDVDHSSGGDRRLYNSGFWGIPVSKGEKYQLIFYTRTVQGGGLPVSVGLESATGKHLSNVVTKNISGSSWQKNTYTFQATGTDTAARLVFAFQQNGSVWLDFVSLFPEKTFKGRANGLRPDLAGYIENLKPSFVRWPGGCYVEGVTIESAPDWKRTIGPQERRPGTFSPWGYWSSDGFGYHEYLQFCEDIHADALYVFNAGVSCEYRSGTYVPEDSLQPYIRSALDAIEYAIGPVTSAWGSKRAASGHPAPFPLKYVEIGNEQHGPKYASRYNLFYKAIREAWPSIRIMASMGIGDVNQRTLAGMEQVDIADEHAYKDAGWSMRNTDHFDRYKRGDWEMYVGEYATNAGVGAGNLQAALADAVYIMGMERNADLVKWSSYAPLLVNTNDIDWPVNLINFNASKSFGRISYYAIKLFSDNRASVNLPTEVVLEQQHAGIPLFAGGIGLGTWDTRAQFRDVEVTQGDKIIYNSTGWKGSEFVRGQWSDSAAVLRQTAMGAQHLAMLPVSFDTGTIRLKARRMEGFNAFMIPFAIGDSDNYLRVHIGSWLNSCSVFEKVTGGFEVSSLSNQLRLKQPIVTGRWYDIRIVIAAGRVDCFLDNEWLMSYEPPPVLHALAGRDSVNGDIILKVVNAGAQPVTTRLLYGGNPSQPGKATLVTLRGENGLVENSFDDPVKYLPVTRTVALAGPEPMVSWPPFSINVLRIPAAGNR